MGNVTLLQGDCLDLLPTLPSQSVDLCLSDWPYGTTSCAWDSVIPLDRLWPEIKRVLTPRGAVVLTASQPFTSALVMSNPKWFRCEWIWKKPYGGNFGNVRFQPMKEHESVLLFAPDNYTYNPIRIPRTVSGKARTKSPDNPRRAGTGQVYHAFGHKRAVRDPETRCPSSVLYFAPERGLHPTQKPLTLFEYLMRTYSNPGDCVLDNTMGSGTTGEAAVRLQRAFVGMELRADYYAVACARCAAAQAAYQPALLEVAP